MRISHLVLQSTVPLFDWIALFSCFRTKLDPKSPQLRTYKLRVLAMSSWKSGCPQSQPTTILIRNQKLKMGASLHSIQRSTLRRVLQEVRLLANNCLNSSKLNRKKLATSFTCLFFWLENNLGTFWSKLCLKNSNSTKNVWPKTRFTIRTQGRLEWLLWKVVD